MIHQLASSFYEGQTREFVLKAEELLRMRELLQRFMNKEQTNLYGLYQMT